MISIRLMRKPGILLMLAVDFLLLGVLLSSLNHPWKAQASSAHALELPAVTEAGMPANGHEGVSLSDQYALLIGQPIFHRDRKYTPPPKAEEKVVQTPPPDFIVTGFLAIPGRPDKAFLRERTGGRTLSVAVGDNLDGWTVTSVGARQVALRQGERSAELIRNGAPIGGTAPISNDAASPASKDRVQPALQPPAVAPAVETPSAVTPPSKPIPPEASEDRMKSLPAKTATISVTLLGVHVTAQKSQPDTPRDFGPPLLPLQHGPLLTYSPPSFKDGN